MLSSRTTYYKNKIEAELDLLDYATKYDPKNTTGVDTSQSAEKIKIENDLANLIRS